MISSNEVAFIAGAVFAIGFGMAHFLIWLNKK